MEVKIFRSDKILSHLDRVNSWVQGGNPPPVTMELDLTNRCNNNCPGCIGARKPLVDLKNPIEIIQDIAAFGVRGLIFSGGGEPTIHKDFIRCVEYAKHLGMDVGVISNGLALSPKMAKQIKPYCTWIRISLDADGPKMHAKIHGVKHCFEPTVNNIRELAKAKGDATIGVGYLTNKETKKGMLKATRLCKKLRVDYIQFRPFHYDFTNIDDELEKCMKLATNGFKVLYSQHKYESMKRRDFGRDYKKCYGQQFASTIAATGKMYVCCHMRGIEKYCIGDLNKNNLVEIWYSDRRKKVLDSIKDLDKCDAGGGCEHCVPLCRCNTFNSILWHIKARKEHKNFL